MPYKVTATLIFGLLLSGCESRQAHLATLQKEFVRRMDVFGVECYNVALDTTNTSRIQKCASEGAKIRQLSAQITALEKEMNQ